MAHDESREGALDVLVVDDSDESVLVVRTFLTRLGHRPRVARTGALALEALAGAPCDLVLMDIEMPGMDGLEAARRIRAGQAGERAASVRMVAMTAEATDERRRACLEAGMAGMLAKPVRMGDLRAVLEALPGPGPLEHERILAELDGDAGLLDDLCAIFRRNAPAHLENLGRALEGGDRDAALLASHSLKGNAATIGARDLSAGAAMVYGMVREGDLSGASRAAAGLEPLMDEVLSALDARPARGEA